MTTMIEHFTDANQGTTNDHQRRLCTSMVSTIENFKAGRIEFARMVVNLERTLDRRRVPRQITHRPTDTAEEPCVASAILALGTDEMSSELLNRACTGSPLGTRNHSPWCGRRRALAPRLADHDCR